MAIKRTFSADNAVTIYAKPNNADFVASPWGDDTVPFEPIPTLNRHEAMLDETKDWVIYLQAGGSPANTDIDLGEIWKEVSLQPIIDALTATSEETRAI